MPSPRRKKPTAREALAAVLNPDPAPASPAAEPAPTFKITPKPDALRKLVENPPPRPSVNAFLDHWFAIRGGPAKFAQELSDEFDEAEPGSLVRTQIIQLVMRSMKVADAKEAGLDELGLVTDADLFRMIDDLGKKIVADSTTPTPPSAP